MRPQLGSPPGHSQLPPVAWLQGCRPRWDPAAGLVVEAERLGDDGCRVCRTKEDRSHHGTSSENAFFANFSASDAPFPTKVRLALANSWRKVRTRSDCCGSYGEPGC
jgi:hypothetical protein